MPRGFSFPNHRWFGPRWNGSEHVLFGVDERRRVVARHFEAMPMSDGVGRTGFDAIPAENTAVIVDVINLRVTLAAADTHLIGVLGGFDIDAVGRARSRAKETGHAFFKTVLVTLQHVNSAKTLLQFRRLIRIIFRHGGRHHLLHRDSHAFGYSRRRAEYFTDDICHFFLYGNGTPHGSQFFEHQPGRRDGTRSLSRKGVTWNLCPSFSRPALLKPSIAEAIFPSGSTRKIDGTLVIP